jgi:hypothetical protein
MSYATPVVGLAFLVLGLVFRAQSSKEADEVKRRNARFAGSMMLLAGAGFLLAFAISSLGV